jgi:transposase InsO family protein
VRRYERARPGELLHVVHQEARRFWTLGKRVLGPEVGNRSRRAVGWYAERGVTVERVLSDNGNGYRSRLWRATCAELGIARTLHPPAQTANQRL